MVSGGPSNPVATVTTTSPHGLIPGNYVQITNVGDPTYHDALNGAVVPVLEVTSSSQFTVAASYGSAVMPNGDYSAGYGVNHWLVKAMNQYMDLSWLTWLNVYMNGYFQVVADYAQGGTSASVGVALIPKIQSGPPAEYAFIQYCTNDLNTPTPDISGCVSNVETIVAAVLNMGMVPIVCLPLPIGQIGALQGDPASAVKTSALQAVRTALLQLASQDPRVLVLDTYAASVDPTDPLGRFKANYAPYDGIHPSSYGAASIAEAMALYLQPYFLPPDTLPIAPVEGAIVQNGLMAGSSGSIGTSDYNVVSGTSPTGWHVAALGGTASLPISIAVSGNNSHSGFAGYTLDASIQSAYPGQQIQIGSNGSGASSFGDAMQANQWYRCGFQAFADSDLTSFELSGQVFLNFGSGNTPSVYFIAPQGTAVENGTPWSADQPFTFESQPFFLPQQPIAGAYLLINGLVTGPLTGQQISIGRAFCDTIPNPYQ